MRRARTRRAHTGWDGPYDVHTTFHEPMVLYGYLAAVTSMELVTGVIILPQRQTMPAAKQAAVNGQVSHGHGQAAEVDHPLS
jgi:alkanesulfonate monooxygenase SsuD/methylene tetrahydromethanopterin reductase-like flavin-dependent oxidoreductase (luciferase family)